MIPSEKVKEPKIKRITARDRDKLYQYGAYFIQGINDDGQIFDLEESSAYEGAYEMHFSGINRTTMQKEFPRSNRSDLIRIDEATRANDGNAIYHLLPSKTSDADAVVISKRSSFTTYKDDGIYYKHFFHIQPHNLLLTIYGSPKTVAAPLNFTKFWGELLFFPTSNALQAAYRSASMACIREELRFAIQHIKSTLEQADEGQKRQLIEKTVARMERLRSSS